ncbi:hypothetical protein HII36_26385 [Nonomuraea sp. NN258]|uniref:DUF6203 family protein n=1 Tax=Nonomuraea antri TaxID=2730852 RepID=UPI001567FEF9|nr:DUF6203 family protein [Nonomuraea antri]NRQ35328.1 hypothetical protein [Nonomuraea antri]
MKRFFKLVVARWLARTPYGLAILGLGWLLGRRRRRRMQHRDHHRQHQRETVRAGRR